MYFIIFQFSGLQFLPWFSPREWWSWIVAPLGAFSARKSRDTLNLWSLTKLEAAVPVHVMKNGPGSHMILGDLFNRASFFVVHFLSISPTLSLNKTAWTLAFPSVCCFHTVLSCLFLWMFFLSSPKAKESCPRFLLYIRGRVLPLPPFANGRGPEDPLTPKTMLGRRKTCKGVAGDDHLAVWMPQGARDCTIYTLFKVQWIQVFSWSCFE